MNPIATTSKKVRLSPPQPLTYPPRGGRTSPVSDFGVMLEAQGSATDAFSPRGEKREMIKSAIVKLPLGIWRDSRPRFVPGPNLRKLGYKGRDLRHANGDWFTLPEANAELQRIQAEVHARKHQSKTTATRPPKPTAKVEAVGLTHGLTLGQAVEAFFALPEMKGKPVVDGLMVRKALSPVTVAGYEKYATLVEAACARMDSDNTWVLPVAAIGPKRMQSLVNEIWRTSGPIQARKARGFLSSMWGKVAAKQPHVLKGLFLELDAIPTAPGRIRPAEPHEFWAMVEAAESMGRYDMADMFFWAVLHGDRQTDRLNPTVIERSATHITLKHSKTGQVTTKLLDPWLQSRMAANATRRQRRTIVWPQMIIDERLNQPWARDANSYQKTFAAIRKHASLTCPTLRDTATSKGLRDQDWRDTNQTWLDRASIDPRTMALVAGHSFQKSEMQKRHYVASNQDKIDKAVLAISAILTNTAPKAQQEIEG
jgi:hypothetical protein